MVPTDSFKIISTLGNSSLHREFLKYCEKISQLNFRLNGSHLSAFEIQNYTETIQQVVPAAKTEIYLDLQGNKFRIGHLRKELTLVTGDLIRLTLSERASSKDIPITDPDLIQNVARGESILLQDAAIQLQVESTESDGILARIIRGGQLRSKAGIHFPTKEAFSQKATPMQLAQIQQAYSSGIQNLALSYVKHPAELQNLKNICQHFGYHPRLIAKIEHPISLQNLAELAAQADEIWFCRGDLGMFIPLKDLSHWQSVTIHTAKEAGKPILIAGEVFHHLTQHPQPTRSEVVHFSMIIEQGIDGIVLSDETAIGVNPIRALSEIIDLM